MYPLTMALLDVYPGTTKSQDYTSQIYSDPTKHKSNSETIAEIKLDDGETEVLIELVYIICIAILQNNYSTIFIHWAAWPFYCT